MTRAKRGFGAARLCPLRIALIGTMAMAILSGCNGSDDAATAASATGAGATGSDTLAKGGPTLQGTAITTATVGTVYSFTPQATAVAGRTLTFSVTNKPSWAIFSVATGQ